MSFFDKLIKKKTNSVVGIDIGSSNIKVVQIRKDKGRLVLESYGSLTLGPSVGKELGRAVSPTMDALMSSLNTLIREANITASSTAFSVPSSSCFLSIIDLPAVSDQKIAQIVPYEARKYIPVDIDEVSLNWNILPESIFEAGEVDAFGESKTEVNPTAPKKRKVLIMVMQNKELRKYVALIKGSSLISKNFESEVICAWKALASTSKVPVLVTDIGASTTKFYVMDHGVVLRNHVINQGGENITKVIANQQNIKFEAAEKMKIDMGLGISDEATVKSMKNVLQEILSEANHVIANFENKYKRSVSRVVFTGGGSTLTGLMGFAGQCVNTPIELADPFSRLQHPLFLSETLRSAGAEFTVAIGAAMGILR